MEELRKQIDECDDQIMALLERRFDVVRDVARYKKAHGLPIKQSDRMNQLVDRLAQRYGSDNLSQEFIADLYRLIMGHAIDLENETIDDQKLGN